MFTNYHGILCCRLRDPHTCPFDGRRNDSCDCMTDSITIAGRTMFKRVRINVHTLNIIGKMKNQQIMVTYLRKFICVKMINLVILPAVDDYKFSMKIGNNNIEYGKAGDCYSQLDCPQGRFGINLSGTLLMLAPEVHWPKQNNAHSVINRIVSIACTKYPEYENTNCGPVLNWSE